MAQYIVTGTAGFIGARVSQLLLNAGHNVTGIDNLNDAYDIRVKHWRLNELKNQSNFNFIQIDISDRNAIESTLLMDNGQSKKIDAVINLAARAGVRTSLEDPWVYLETNSTGTLNFSKT